MKIDHLYLKVFASTDAMAMPYSVIGILSSRMMQLIEDNPYLSAYACFRETCDVRNMRRSIETAYAEAIEHSVGSAKLSTAGDAVGVSLLHRFQITSHKDSGRCLIEWTITRSEMRRHECA